MSNSVRVAMWKSARLRAGFLCAAVLATLGFPASSLAQSSLTQTGYLLDSELERVKETMKRGCRYANEGFPGFARGFSFDQEAAPLSRTEYNRIHNEWSKLPICPTTNVAVQPFFGVNIGGAFQSTNFSVDPPFTINGSGFTGGGFGGVLLPVPNTNALFGFRVGGQGSNITGDIRMPAASPTFTYRAQTNWIAYQEAVVESAAVLADLVGVDPREAGALYRRGGGLFAIFGLGVAESGTSVRGTSGTFSVTDNAVRPGITFSAGVGMPLFRLPNGIGVDGLVQYRGIVWSSAVNIPGSVPIDSYTSEVTAGLIFPIGP